ncbi:MAG: dTDP-4-amino-4,6-dideoxygalactose transaminase [Pirellulaceae bacterium]|nr:dTDP-4-amino-4,6-dideoxygalactose transaminase [Pirellulaceae bacterium]
MTHRIPLSRPFISGKELEYVTQAISRGATGSDGEFTRRCASLLEDQFDIGKVLMTPSCTAALEIAAMLCDLEPGDEVIMPSFTFVSTANAVVRAGARPVFVDVRPDTLNINESSIEDAITERTRAIIPVHYAGVACEMDTIMDIARRHGLLVIEDAAQAVNAFYKGQALGSIGDLGCYSFHDTKNYVCGEGGAICVNRPDFVERAEIIREKGTNRAQFFRGEVDKYTWVDIGSSFVPAELASAFLLAQLEQLEAIQTLRKEIHEFYTHQLQPLEAEGLLRVGRIPDHSDSNYHIFHILLPDVGTRDNLLEKLREDKIGAAFHYVPLHSSPMGNRIGRTAERLRVTESVSNRLLRLPLFCGIAELERTRVVETIKEHLCLTARRTIQPKAA